MCPAVRPIPKPRASTAERVNKAEGYAGGGAPLSLASPSGQVIRAAVSPSLPARAPGRLYRRERDHGGEERLPVPAMNVRRGGVPKLDREWPCPAMVEPRVSQRRRRTEAYRASPFSIGNKAFNLNAASVRLVALSFFMMLRMCTLTVLSHMLSS
jgi:hypothetical protein